MKEYLAKFKDKDIDSIAIVLYINDGKAGELGRKIQENNSEFTGDGKTWATLLSNYFENQHPALFKEIEFDPEPSMLTIYFELSKENDVLSKKFIEILENYIETGIPLQ